MSLLEEDNTRKEKMDKNKAKQLEFEAGGNNKKYKVESICNSTVYARNLETGHLLGLYNLVSWKSYSEDKNTW